MEASPFDNISDREWNDLHQLICTIKVSWDHIEPRTQTACSAAIYKLWKLANHFRYKPALTHPSFRLLPLFKKILQDSSNVEMKNNTLGCIWYLSRHPDNYMLIGSKELGLLKICADLLIENHNEMCYNILRNCGFDCRVHAYLLHDDMGYLAFFKHEMIHLRASIYPYHVLAAISSTLQESDVHFLTKWRFPQMVCQRLISGGVDPSLWPGREYGIEDHSMSFLACLSAMPATRELLLSINPFEFFYSLSKTTTIEGDRACIILVNLYGDHLYDEDATTDCHHRMLMEVIERKGASMEHARLTRFLLVFLSIIDCQCPEYAVLQRFGHHYGSVMLRVIILFFYHLTLLSPTLTTRFLVVTQPIFLQQLMAVIDAFREDTTFTAPNDVGRIYGGGGRRDELSIQYTLQLIQRFCLFYDISDEDYRGTIRSIFREFQLRSKLSSLISANERFTNPFLKPLLVHVVEYLQTIS